MKHMKTAPKTFLLALLLQFLVGCATTMPALETPTERLAAIETSYQGVLKTVTQWRAEGRLTESQIAAIDEAIYNYKATRDLARIVIITKDEAEASDAVSNVSRALTTIRSLLAEAS